MPSKTHRPTAGIIRSHSRSSSGSKVALNLHFSQKDSVRHTEKSKKSGLAHETHTSRSGSPYPRVNSSLRVHSKEHIPSVALKPSESKQNGPIHNFTTSPTTDDDEWVSSESGAVTPSNGQDIESDGEISKTPIEQIVKPVQNEERVPHEHVQAETPIPRVATVRPLQPLGVQDDRAATAAPASRAPTTSDRPPLHAHPYHSGGTQTRSEVIIPPSRDSRHTPVKRNSVTRPPSMHSVTDTNLRPHPLIRGNSFGNCISNPPKPVPLGPLTVKADSSPGQISSSPPPSGALATKLSSSPTSMKTSSGSPSSPSHLRRTSISSARSVATLPLPPTHQQPGYSGHDRTRNLSTISSSSTASMAALSSLVQLPVAHTRPSTPQRVFFPVVSPNFKLESIHPLLPAPYIKTHLTVLAHQTPIRASYDRVIRAKQGR